MTYALKATANRAKRAARSPATTAPSRTGPGPGRWWERLAPLPPGSREGEQLRGQLVELHLPLVEYLARRFRNRGEWLDDLTQVATIGLIKAIDRFDPEA